MLKTELNILLTKIKIKLNHLRRLFCYHKWIETGNPYLWDCGKTKRVDVRCVKCNKLSNVDLYETPKRKWQKI